MIPMWYKALRVIQIVPVSKKDTKGEVQEENMLQFKVDYEDTPG